MLHNLAPTPPRSPTSVGLPMQTLLRSYSLPASTSSLQLDGVLSPSSTSMTSNSTTTSPRSVSRSLDVDSRDHSRRPSTSDLLQGRSSVLGNWASPDSPARIVDIQDHHDKAAEKYERRCERDMREPAAERKLIRGLIVLCSFSPVNQFGCLPRSAKSHAPNPRATGPSGALPWALPSVRRARNGQELAIRGFGHQDRCAERGNSIHSSCKRNSTDGCGYYECALKLHSTLCKAQSARSVLPADPSFRQCNLHTCSSRCQADTDFERASQRRNEMEPRSASGGAHTQRQVANSPQRK